jgi:hypothetical protein
MTIRKEIEKTIDYDYLQEQVPSASILELIENKTKLVKDVFKINSTSYKCLSKKSLSNQTHSVYIIVRAEIETLNLNVSDIVYSNSSCGYFETISEIDYINTFKHMLTWSLFVVLHIEARRMCTAISAIIHAEN